MPKMLGFLRFLGVCVVAMFVATGAYSAGYTCSSSMEYTSCNKGYYLTGTGAGNDCAACPSLATLKSQTGHTGWTWDMNTAVTSGVGQCRAYTSATAANCDNGDGFYITAYSASAWKSSSKTWQAAITTSRQSPWDSATQYYDENAVSTVFGACVCRGITASAGVDYVEAVLPQGESVCTYYITPKKGYGQNSPNTKCSVNKTSLTATCPANSYTILLYEEGGEPNVSDISATYGVSYTLPTVSKPGYKFQGWLDIVNGVTYNGTVSNLVSEHNGGIELYADWGQQTYTVTLDGNGATSTDHQKTLTVTYNSSFGMSDEGFPSRTGYKFAGYWTDKVGGTIVINDWGEGQGIWQNPGGTTLYAHWTPITYTIKFNTNGGTPQPADIKATYDTGYILPSVSKTGYIFDFWDDGSTGYSAGDEVGNLTTVNGATVTMTASWLENPYTVKFNANGGTGSASPTSRACYYSLSCIAATVGTMAKTGHTFKGWSTSASATTATYAAGANMGSLTSEYYETINLYAVWEPNTITVAYSGNSNTGGSKPTSPTSCSYNGTCNAPSNTYTRTGYTFAGWKCTGGGTSCDGDIVAPGASISTRATSGTITLTAQWCANCNSSTANCSLTANTNTGACTYSTSCKAGYHTLSNGSTATPSCKAVDDGYYSANGVNNQTACTATKQGIFIHSDSGRDSVNDCYFIKGEGEYAGYYYNGTTMVACGSGTYMPTTNTDKVYYTSTGYACIVADKGYYVSSTAAKSQTACANGSYSSSTKSTACTPCAAGTTNSGTGNTAACTTQCSASIAGVASWNTTTWNSNNIVSNLCSVKSCSANRLKSGNTCPTCENVAASGYNYSNAGSTDIGQCYLTTTTGKYVKKGGEGLEPCPAGSYCPGGTKVYYGTAGGVTTGGSNQCVQGSYSADGASACTACKNGKTTSGTGKTSCDATCSNAGVNVKTWKDATWTTNNTVTNLCTISACQTCSGNTGASCSVSLSSNTCTATTSCKTGYSGLQNQNQYNAYCSPVVYTITLNDNTGSGGNGAVYQKYANGWSLTNFGSAVSKLTKLPSKDGHTFAGYFAAKTGGSAIITADGTLPANTTFTANTELYAQYTIVSKTCSAGFYMKKGEQACTTPCPAGYFCAGGKTCEYSTTSDCGIEQCTTGYSTGSAQKCSSCASGYAATGSDVTNHDEIGDCKRTLTLDKNGGSGTLATTTTVCHQVGSGQAVCPNVPNADNLTLFGYGFSGNWGTSATATTCFNAAAAQSGQASAKISTSLGTLYACKNKLAVRLMYQTGIDGDTRKHSPGSYAWGESFKLPDYQFDLSGYSEGATCKTVGWMTESGELYEIDDWFVISEYQEDDYVLTAMKDCLADIDFNGGEVSIWYPPMDGYPDGYTFTFEYLQSLLGSKDERYVPWGYTRTIEWGEMDPFTCTGVGCLVVPFMKQFESIMPGIIEGGYDPDEIIRWKKTGYTFSGNWNSKANGTGVDYTQCMMPGCRLAYAQWTPNKYDISYNCGDGATGGMTGQLTYELENTLAADVCSKTGYMFDGWLIDGQKYSAGAKYTMRDTVAKTATAQWVPILYTIKFNANGGTPAPSNIDATYGQSYSWPSVTRTGYTLDGWKSDYDNNTYLPDDEPLANMTPMDGDIVVLTAQWVPNKYDVSYNCGEGASGTVPTNNGTATYDANYTPSANTGCVKEGHTFSGWKVSGTSDVRTAGTAFKWTYTDAKTFTATWTIISAGVCPEGYYMPAKHESCDTQCESGYYCPGGEKYDYNATDAQGRYGCPSANTANGWAYDASEVGLNDVKQCAQYKTAPTATCSAGRWKQNAIDANTWGATDKNNVTARAGAFVDAANLTCTVCPVNTYQTSGTYAGTSCPSTCAVANGYVTSGTALSNHDAQNDCVVKCSDGQYVATAGGACGYINKDSKYVAEHTVAEGNTSGAAVKNCPTQTKNWTLGTGTGWSSVTQCFETRTPDNCTSGTIRHYAATADAWDVDNTTVAVTLKAKSGYYAAGIACTACEAGKYCTGDTAQPKSCVIGSFSTGTTSSCTACAAGETTVAAGTTSATGCVACNPITGAATWMQSAWNTNNTMSNLCRVASCQDCVLGTGAATCSQELDTADNMCVYKGTCADGYDEDSKSVSGITITCGAGKYNISYELNRGTWVSDNWTKSYTYGIATTITGTAPSRTNSTFVGWCMSASLDNCVANPKISATDIGDKTFWAKWTCNVGSFRSTSQNGTVDTYSATGDYCATCPQYHVCAGGDAKPVLDQVPVTYNLNGGTGSVTQTMCTVGVNCNLVSIEYMNQLVANGTVRAPNANEYTNNYTFVGWSTSSKYNQIGFKSSVNITSGVTMYAIWAADCKPGAYVEWWNGAHQCTSCTSPHYCPGGRNEYTKITANDRYGKYIIECPTGYDADSGTGKDAATDCWMDVTAGKKVVTKNSAEQQTCSTAGEYCPGGRLNYGALGLVKECPALNIAPVVTGVTWNYALASDVGVSGDTVLNSYDDCYVMGTYVATSGCQSGKLRAQATSNNNWGNASVYQTVNAKPGFWVDGLVCTECDAGQYCPGGTVTPQGCDSGMHPNDDASGCVNNTHMVTLAMNYANSPAADSGTVKVTYSVAMPALASGQKPTRHGYTFRGFWDTADGLGHQYYNANGTSARNWDKALADGTPVTLYAQWAPISDTCSAGQYMNWMDGETSCGACESDSYCPGGVNTYDSDVNANGNAIISQCPSAYRANTDTDKSKKSDCQIAVNAGYYLAVRESGTATKCPIGDWCPGMNINWGNIGGNNACPSADSGWTKTSYEYASDWSDCYETQSPANCESGGLIRTAVSKTKYSTTIQGGGDLMAKYGYYVACPNGVYCEDATQCMPCPSGMVCIGGRSEPEPLRPTVVECTVSELPANAESGEKYYNPARGDYDACVITECATDYHLESNRCISDYTSCSVANGTGVRAWNPVTKAYGECVATECAAGWYLSGGRNPRCERCRNAFGVDGELAASFVPGAECEIASCLYQGEKYALENNECVPICLKESDETGSKEWNESTKTCVRTCFEGYSPWK